jgi:CBS domain-containing protein
MTVGKICTKNLVTASRETTVTAAAKLMRQRHVGALIVVGKKAPAGIVTDRDIVISVVAPGLDPDVFTLGDMLLKEPVTCREDLSPTACLHEMRSKGIRRMPVMNKRGMLVGIITLDDILRILAGELTEVAKLIEREQVTEKKTRV